MNEVVVEGVVSSEVTRVQLGSGDLLVRFTVRVPGPDGRRQSLPVVWVGPARRAPRVDGDELVLVVGSLQRRFFRAGPGVQSRTEIRAERVLRRPAGSRRRALLASIAGRLAG